MPLLVFMVIGTIAVASSILVVAMRNPVHSALVPPADVPLRGGAVRA